MKSRILIFLCIISTLAGCSPPATIPIQSTSPSIEIVSPQVSKEDPTPVPWVSTKEELSIPQVSEELSQEPVTSQEATTTNGTEPAPSSTPKPTPVPTPQPTPEPPGSFVKFNFYVLPPDWENALSSQERSDVNAILNAMVNREPSVPLKSGNPEIVVEAFRRSPFAFFVKTPTISGERVELEYWYTPEEQKQMLSWMESETLSILRSILREDDNELDKVLAIYHYVTTTVSYDHSYDLVAVAEEKPFQYPRYEVYTVLQGHTGVCFSFANFTNYLLRQAGMESFTIAGGGNSYRDGHLWVCVRIDGSLTYIDATWDADPTYPSLIYFGETDELRRKHALVYDTKESVLSSYPFVRCNDTTYAPLHAARSFEIKDNHTIEIRYSDGTRHLYSTAEKKLLR
jgi:hypothetical protein